MTLFKNSKLYKFSQQKSILSKVLKSSRYPNARFAPSTWPAAVFSFGNTPGIDCPLWVFSVLSGHDNFQWLLISTCLKESNLSTTAFLVLVIHVLAAIVWLGGMFFISLVLVPSLKKLEPPTKRTEILSVTARRFSLVGWIAILVLLVTGVINSANRGVTVELISSGKLFLSHFGMILSFKVFLVLVMIFISAIHDFILGPRLIRLTERERSSPDSMKSLARKRKLVSWLARINAIIGIIVVACAVMLG